MKTKSLLMPIFLLTMNAVHADEVSPLHTAFSGNLGSADTAKDILQGTCLSQPPSLALAVLPVITAVKASVSDELPVAAPKVTVRVKTNIFGTARTDATDGNGTFSLSSDRPAVEGTVFQIHVYKTGTTKTGAENYKLNYHCENGTANHPVPILTYVQNQ